MGRTADVKRTRLEKWAEVSDILPGLDADDLGKEFETLRISSPKGKLNAKPSISPGMILRFAEHEDEFEQFEDIFEDGALTAQQLEAVKRRNLFENLPATLSTSSPRRKSLGEYSEGTETDVTELNDADLDDLDDIFGKEESGIYSSGGSKPNISRASQVLQRKKAQLQSQAAKEDEEYFQRYRQSVGDDFATLKLRQPRGTLSRLESDALENEKTVNYELSRDILEQFEDGFDGDQLLSSLNGNKLRQFYSRGELLRKASMPVFPSLLKSSKMSKFKSSVDLAAVINDEHPFFNNSNKLIKKLGRMPSFHNRKDLVGLLPEEQKLDENMELKKKELLEKYMEITEKQKQLRHSPIRETARRQRRGVGLVKYLNHTEYAPDVGQSKMKYNALAKRWEGNDHELIRFEDVSPRKSQPSLITLKDFQPHKEKLKGNMIYDSENLRWVNMDKNDLDVGIFDEVPDLEPNDLPQFRQPERGASAFTQRTVLTVSSDASASKGRVTGNEFQISDKLQARFEKEEAKIRKKIHHWFGPHETYRLDRRGGDTSYFWDIRKMVVEDASQ